MTCPSPTRKSIPMFSVMSWTHRFMRVWSASLPSGSAFDAAPEMFTDLDMLGIGRGRKTPEKLHRKLNAFNRVRLSPSLDAASWDGGLSGELKLRHAEYRFIEAERACVHGWAATAPMHPPAFLEWYEALQQHGPGQNDALFPWL